ncbi:VPLPA-CTERM sorting domain-containing protein [Yoonia sp. R2331]|uniref:VPLPA-CTERM sorting domain-containing protein n=1 Tax=Yoonia sp. R2331 TaxID=3237238 RepID=UPI0034E53C61
MKNLKTIASAVALAIAASTASAGNVSYDATSYAPGGHSLWFSGLGAPLGKHFHFDPSGLFNTDMTSWGQLLGTVTSANDSTNGFQVSFNYDGDTTGLGAFKNGGGGMTGGSAVPGTNGVWGGTLNPDIFFLNMTGGTLTGFGDKLGGIKLDVTRKPSNGIMAAQIGTGANDKNGNFGMSNWFYTICDVCSNAQYDFTSAFNNKQGDVNVNLVPNGGNLTDVPLPAAGWMLIAGLGGLAAAKRRRKKA